MATDLGSAYFQLVPSMRGFQSTISKQFSGVGVNEGRAVGTRFTSGLGSVIGGSAIAGVFGGVAAAATTAVGNAVSGAFKAAGAAVIGFNSQLQNSTIGFESVLGSADKAQAFVGDLQKFAAKTPFDFQSLVQYAQTLTGFGVSAKKVIPSLTALGDAVANSGGSTDQLNSAVLAYSQLSAKQTVDLGNVLQLQNAGVPALKYLAAAYHTNVGAIQDQISAGKILSAEALPALNKAIEEGAGSAPALGGAMDKLSTTFTGAANNIGDNATQLIAKAFKPLFDSATTTLQGIATLLGSPSLKNFATNFSAGLQGVIASFAPVRQAVTDFFTGFTQGTDAINSVQTTAAAVGATVYGAFAQARQAVSDFFTGFTKGTDAIGSVQSVAASLGAALYGTFASLGPIFQPLVTAFQALGPVVLTAFQNLAPLGVLFRTLAPVLPQIAQVFAQLASIIGTVLAQALAVIVPVVTQIVGILSGTLIQIMPVIVQLVGAVGSALAVLAPAVLGLLAPILQLVGTLIQQLAPIFVQLVTTILPPVIQILGLVVAAIAPLIQTISATLIPIIQALLPVITAVFGAIVPIIQGALQIVVGVIQVVTGIITGNWKQVWSGLSNIVGGAFNTIVAVIRGAVGIVTAAIKFVLDAGVAIFKGAVKFFADAGRSIIDAIAGGIRDRIQIVGNAISGVMDFIKGFFPHSPAKRGPFSGSGWTRVAKSGAALADQFTSGFNNGVTDFASTVGGMTPSGLSASMSASIGDATAGGTAVLINNKTNVRLEDLIDVRVQRGADADSRAIRLGYQPVVFG